MSSEPTTIEVIQALSNLAETVTVVAVLLWRLIIADRLLDRFIANQSDRIDRLEVINDSERHSKNNPPLNLP